ncbi:MAG TPA: FAD-dependent oxidoreductase [Xanthobacteraceae bacterium]|nr:FAD-dependent oxidoreductase [Xanthobacteraceae bacterium]
MSASPIITRCSIVGGGPGGMMLGYLLARAGIDVVVLEKHADFLRDFRGDTIHPSTLELMRELGLLDAFLRLPHRKVERLVGEIGNVRVTMAEFTRLSSACKFIALMPQWDFLDFLADRGRRYAGFHFMMNAEATDLIERDGQVVGVQANTQSGVIEVSAHLVIGADGRHSVMRERAGLKVEDLGAPMDVLWMRLSRRPDDCAAVFGHIETGGILVMLDRGDYWQCAYVIRKGSAEEVMNGGIGDFRRTILALSPWLGERVNELKSWDDVKLLTVALDRLSQWYRPGLLCIGDAAHAMSPIGGVGINLAIQDAVAAANILAEPLRACDVTVDHLARVQRRRQWPTWVTQAFQRTIQTRVIAPVLAGTAQPKLPFAVKLLNRLPALRAIPARFIGIGVRPEHIRTKEAAELGPH